LTKKKKHKKQTKAVNNRRSMWWIVGVIILTGVAAVGYLFWEQDPTHSGPDPSNLIGRWLRPDGGYQLQLSDPAPDGHLKAAYFNPRPINVSRAHWMLQDSLLKVFIELRDVNYPGSTYTLEYHPDRDRLKGIYFQAALRQNFEVEFERVQ
jgi:hypothetical protein